MNHYDQARHLDTAEVAALLRKALKAKFPSCKFSVRTARYAGGSSVDVGWIDGPTWKEVKEITDGFNSQAFDPMIDLAYSTYQWLLPDGTMTLAYSPGTYDNGGSNPPIDIPKPHPKAELVSSYCHVNAQRALSPAHIKRALETALNYWGDLQPIEWQETQWGGRLYTADYRTQEKVMEIANNTRGI